MKKKFSVHQLFFTARLIENETVSIENIAVARPALCEEANKERVTSLTLGFLYYHCCYP